MWRSIVSVGGGFFGMVVLVMIGTAAAAAALLPGGLTAMSKNDPAAVVPQTYLAANLLVSLAGAALGGWLAARFAPSAPWTHACVLAGIVLLLSLATALGSGAAPGQPAWYPWVIGVVGLAGVLTGGVLARG